MSYCLSFIISLHQATLSYIYREAIRDTEYFFKANHTKIAIETCQSLSKTQLRNTRSGGNIPIQKGGTKIMYCLSESRHY